MKFYKIKKTNFLSNIQHLGKSYKREWNWINLHSRGASESNPKVKEKMFKQQIEFSEQYTHLGKCYLENETCERFYN